jgi:transaldolase
MNATQRLHSLSQSLWLDNITRGLLVNGTLQRYIREYSVTGLTSNPAIFDKAIKEGDFYDAAIRQKTTQGKSGEALFFELALEDLTQAADLFRPIHDLTERVDGWVSLEVSPLLANDTTGTVNAVAQLHRRAQRPNLFIKIPGTLAGVPAIEESIFVGVPVNVTLLFSREQYIASAEAYMRGIERRIDTGLDPKVASVASIFVSRWDVAVKDKVPEGIRNRLGIAIAQRAYKAYREILAAPPAGERLSSRAPDRNACSGRAPAPRIQLPPTHSTSKRWRPRTQSTRYPIRPWKPSPITVNKRGYCRLTEVMPKRRSRTLHGRVWTLRSSPLNCNAREPNPSTSRGPTSWAAWPRSVLCWERLLESVRDHRDHEPSGSHPTAD